MPIYEYQCRGCAHRMEVLQKISDPPLADCPECGRPALKKLVSAASFRLKGGGWYETDFKHSGRRPADGKAEGEDGGKEGKDGKADGGGGKKEGEDGKAGKAGGKEGKAEGKKGGKGGSGKDGGGAAGKAAAAGRPAAAPP